MMPFRNLDYIPKIPAKPPKLPPNSGAQGPKTFGGEYLKISECNFPQKLIFGTRLLPLYARQIWSKSIEYFLHSAFPPWEIGAGQGPKSKGKSEKVRVLLSSGWGIVSYHSIKLDPALLRIYFIFSIFKISKIRPSPQGGPRGMGSCTVRRCHYGKVP